MNRNSRYFLVAVALTLVSLLVGACGGPATTAAPAPTEAPAEEPTEAPAEEPTEAPAEEPTEAPAAETIPLSFNFGTTNSQIRIDIATIAQQNLADIGVEMKPEHMPAGTWFGTYGEGGPIYAPGADGGPQYDLGGYTTGFYPDPWTDDHICSNIPNAANGGAGDNGYHLCDPQVDELFAELNASVDPDTRKATLAEIQQHLHDQAYFVMMYARANVYGHTDRFVPAPFGFFSNLNWNAEEWDTKDDVKIVTGAWDQEPNNVNPYYTVMSYAIWIAQLTSVGLGEWDETGTLVPELAEEIPSAANGGISEDGLTITWKLKEGLLWSDGEPITANDVVFTWQSIVDPANVAVQTSGYTEIESVTALDELTVEIKFKSLYPPWPTLFTQGPNNSGAIMPAHILEGQTGLENNPEIHQPTVASGPFMISEWIAGDHMSLVPNPNFYKGAPKLEQINIKFVPNPEAATAGLQTGDIDWFPNYSEAEIATIGALEPAVHLVVVPGADFEHYFFNMATTEGVNGVGQSDYDGFCAWKDVRVRKAIILGIDRFTIVETLLGGETTVPAHQWPNSFWDSGIEPYPYDPDQAMALLDEAGFTDQDGDGIREGVCPG
jgi:ABC-type transport system substrate-binding protein